MENKTMQNKDWFEKCVRDSKSIKESLIKMGYNTPSNFYRMFNKYLDLYKTSTNHFSGEVKNRSKGWKNEEVFVEDFKGSINGNMLKKRLYAGGLKSPICELCNQDENWKTGKISLILDHINGNNKDNRVENLRIVCPNCDATLPTFKSRNITKKPPFNNHPFENYENHIINEYKTLIQNYISEGYGWRQKSMNYLGWSKWKFNQFLRLHFTKEELKVLNRNGKELTNSYLSLLESNTDLIDFNKRVGQLD